MQMKYNAAINFREDKAWFEKGTASEILEGPCRKSMCTTMTMETLSIYDETMLGRWGDEALVRCWEVIPQ